MCYFSRRHCACGHSDVGERLRLCDFRRLRNKECNRFTLTPDTTVETEQCTPCREGGTSVGAYDQDFAHSDAVSPPALGFEVRGRSSVEKNGKPLPRLIGERDVPGEGPTFFYEDGTTCKRWGVTKAAPRKPLAVACTQCREQKIKCDPTETKCVQCAKFGRACSLLTSGSRNLGDKSPNFTEEAQKPGQARFFNSEQSLNDEVPRPLFPKVPSQSASPKTSKKTSQHTRPVPILAHNLSLSPQSRKYLPEWVPQQAGHRQATDGSLSAAVLQPLRTYGAVPLRTLLTKYYLLDTISRVKIDNAKACLDAVHAERPARSLADSVNLLYAKPPKVWLAIRHMIRDPFFDNLYVLDIIFDAKLYTDYVLSHTASRPTLGPIEQMFVCPALFDCIRVRQYMLNMLFREIQVFILEVDSGEKAYSDARFPSDHQSSANCVPAEERTQAVRKSKRWLQNISQRILDRILNPIVKSKPLKCAFDAFMLTKRSKLNCTGL